MVALMSITGVLLLASFICTILAAMTPPRLNLWVAVLLLVLANLVALAIGTRV